MKLMYAMCLFLAVGCHRKAQSQQNVGAFMPDFTFYTLKDSVAFTKGDIEAKKSVIILFDTSCSHCQDEIDSVGKHFGEFNNLNFYLVSMDDKVEIGKFMSKYGKVLNGKKNVTVLRDTAHEFIPKFQPAKFPALYIYSEKKKLIASFSGEKEIEEIIAAAK